MWKEIARWLESAGVRIQRRAGSIPAQQTSASRLSCRKRVPDHLERVELGKEARNRRCVPPAHKSGLKKSEVSNINDVFKRLGETFTFPVPSNLSDVWITKRSGKLDLERRGQEWEYKVKQQREAI